jgi:hypothetical protein
LQVVALAVQVLGEHLDFTWNVITEHDRLGEYATSHVLDRFAEGWQQGRGLDSRRVSLGALLRPFRQEFLFRRPHGVGAAHQRIDDVPVFAHLVDGKERFARVIAHGFVR